jgi:hypothetical protein
MRVAREEVGSLPDALSLRELMNVVYPPFLSFFFGGLLRLKIWSQTGQQ